MVVFPNAKINLGLNITSRREDGYHILTSIMLPIGWHDILEIVPSNYGATTLTTSGNKVDCPPESIIVMKAYRALANHAKLPSVNIYLRKIIPDGAGLGGGSADAAFTLKALNNMFKLNYSDDELAEIASTLGADCPFFIYNRPMIAEGIGTDLTPTDISVLSGKTLLIVKPDIHISTAEAYAPHLAMTGASRGFSQGAVPGWGFSRDRTGSSGRLLWCHGSQVSMDVAWGSASLLSSHGRGIKPQDASKKNSRGLSRGVAGNPGFPRLVPMTSGSLAGFL